MEDGEKPTKYFLSLEKRHYTNKTIVEIVTDSGEIIADQTDILKQVKAFYADLYRSRDLELDSVDLARLFQDENVPKLSDVDKNKLDEPITKHEVLCALKNTKNNKVPGLDGFSINFYNFFWVDIGDFVYRSFVHSFEKGELSISQILGLIHVSMLPKGSKPRNKLKKNWRPISLLNVTYKLISTVMANRLKTDLDKLFMKTKDDF